MWNLNKTTHNKQTNKNPHQTKEKEIRFVVTRGEGQGGRMGRRCQKVQISNCKITHSSIVAWRIPRTEESCRLYSQWGCKESDTTERVSPAQGDDVWQWWLWLILLHDHRKVVKRVDFKSSHRKMKIFFFSFYCIHEMMVVNQICCNHFTVYINQPCCTP